MTNATLSTEITPEVKAKLEVDTRDLVARAKDMIIATEQDNTAALNLTAAYKKQIKVCKEVLRPTEEALKASKEAFNGLWDLLITPLESGVKIIAAKSGDFMLLEQRRRTELQRIEDEKVATAQRKEDERIARLTAKAEEAGKPAPVIAPKVIPQRVVAAIYTPPGTTQQEYYSAEVTCILDLCKAVVDGKADTDCVMGNMPYLNGLSKLKKIEGLILPGVMGKKRIGATQR